MPDLRLWADKELARLKRDMDRLFDGLLSDCGLPRAHQPRASVDIVEQGDRIEVRMALPGVEPDELNVTVEEYGVTVEHVSREQAPGRSATSTSTRRFGLPCRIDPNQASAVFKDQLLIVTLPKCGETICRTIGITRD